MLENTYIRNNVFEDFFNFLGCSYLLHSAINPFLYSICSKRFRRGFLDVFNKSVKSSSKKHEKYNQYGNEISFNGNTRGQNRKKVVNKRTLLRHFDNPLLSPEDNNIHLERDKVIPCRNRSKQLTILKKCSSSFIYKQHDSGIINEIPQQHSEPLYQGILGSISRDNCFLSNRNSCCGTNFRHCSSSHVDVPHNSMRSLATTSKLKQKLITTRIQTQQSENSNQISRTGFPLSNRDGQYVIRNCSINQFGEHGKLNKNSKGEKYVQYV